MEATFGSGEKKRAREEGDDMGLGFSFGSVSGTASPQKLNHVMAFPSSGYYDGARVLQPMNFPVPFFKSSGNGIGGNSGAALPLRAFPFTLAQWQELQRQALIYKHIMASVPVPPDLLYSLPAALFPDAPPFLFSPTMVCSGGGAGFNLRFSNGMDPEPGRCRRTDGKKWRCSRDVAPDQKYCERHVHRGRPRSRKPVETRTKTKPTSTTSKPTSTTSKTPANKKTSATTASVSSLSEPFSSPPTCFPPEASIKLSFPSTEVNKEARCRDWAKNDTENMMLNQQWELMHSNIGLSRNTTAVLPHYENQLNLDYANLKDHCCSFLNPEISSLDENGIADDSEPARRFIDAWSCETITANAHTANSSAVPTREKLPLSTLTLSMSSCVEEGTDQMQMGIDLNHDDEKSQSLNWMAPVSAPGGPLGEVLQSGNMTSPRDSCGASTKNSCVDLINLMCKSCCRSQEVSPQDSPTRLVSSPSGVLHKALASLSDSSCSSSPTAFQWMNQSKQG